MKDFKDRVAVVTGGASGIGLAMAERFIAESMKVVLADIDPQLEAVAQRLRDGGAEALAVRTDVSDPAQVNALAARTMERFGAAHIICNNAGTGGPATFLDFGLEDWQFQIGVNLWGVIHGIRAFLPILKKQDEGHIVNTSSMAAFLNGSFTAPYNVSKAGVVALTETLYNELALDGSNVHISVLCPGAVVTRMNDEPNVPAHLKMLARPAPPAIQKMRGALREAFNHALDPKDVAEMVVDAIRHERLYIMTHPQYGAMVRQRFEAIVAGADQAVASFEEIIPTARHAHGHES